MNFLEEHAIKIAGFTVGLSLALLLTVGILVVLV